MEHTRPQSYRSWLLGEIVLVALLSSATALFALSSSLQSAYPLPEARLVLDTAVAVVAAIVSVLATVRFLVDGRTLDLLLAAGFWTIALGTVVFGLLPVLGGEPLPPWAAWSLVGARLLGAALIAIAPYVDGRLSVRRPALAAVGVGVAVVLAGVRDRLACPALGRRSRRRGAVGCTCCLAVGDALADGADRLRPSLPALWTRSRQLDVPGRDARPVRRSPSCADSGRVRATILLQGDFLRLVAYGMLLIGVWRAIADAEFGRAVADERARVAREIHDGLAQYLFAISTHVSTLESDAPLEEVLPRLKRASTAAQQEARFAVLALSSAGGSARFDSALRRYIDVLTADGELEVDLDVDRQVRLAPDEQIEVFRIVQEGLGNVRRHAGARHVEVSIQQRGGRRVVSVSDDGIGFDETTTAAGQGLDNIKLRAEAIEGQLSLRSSPGRGTAIEVVLRPT